MAAVAAITEKPTVAAGREIKIGFVYDSADDSARVALVHSYIGTTTVGAYFDDQRWYYAHHGWCRRVG